MGDAEEPIPAAPDADLPFDPAEVEETPRPLARDPVCGRDVNPEHPGGSTEYRAVPYYFCSQLCRAEFLADPSRYVG